MKTTISILALACLVACGTKDKKQELVTFEELVGETGSELNAAAPSLNNLIQLSPALSGFVEGQFAFYDTLQNTQIHPLDRFGYSNSKKLDFKSKAQPERMASVYYYSFKDSVITKNAFYNWLDCFGKDCYAVQLNENVDEIAVNQSFTLVYDTTIVAIEYGCNGTKATWSEFEDSLLNRFGENYKYRIETKCDGPLKWK